MIRDAKRVPLSDDRRVNAERAYELIDRARAEIPSALMAAQWLIREYYEGNPVPRPPAG